MTANWNPTDDDLRAIEDDEGLDVLHVDLARLVLREREARDMARKRRDHFQNEAIDWRQRAERAEAERDGARVELAAAIGNARDLIAERDQARAALERVEALCAKEDAIRVRVGDGSIPAVDTRAVRAAIAGPADGQSRESPAPLSRTGVPDRLISDGNDSGGDDDHETAGVQQPELGERRSGADPVRSEAGVSSVRPEVGTEVALGRGDVRLGVPVAGLPPRGDDAAGLTTIARHAYVPGATGRPDYCWAVVGEEMPVPGSTQLGRVVCARPADDPIHHPTRAAVTVWPDGCRCHNRTGLNAHQHENDCPLTTAGGSS